MVKWNPDDYQKNSKAQQQWAGELIAKLALQGHERVLDIGCGDGGMTREIARCLSKGSVLGIDNSPDMIGFAREKLVPGKSSRLSFETADARDLKYQNEFDVVFSSSVLHWVKDHGPVLRGIRRALKKNGRVLLQMGGKGNAAGIIQAVDRLIKEKKWKDHFLGFIFPYSFYGPEEYTDWLMEAGFRPVRVELMPKDMICASREALAGWIRTTWLPYTERVPEELRKDFIDEIVDQYVKENPADQDGVIHVKMVRLEVQAVIG